MVSEGKNNQIGNWGELFINVWEPLSKSTLLKHPEDSNSGEPWGWNSYCNSEQPTAIMWGSPDSCIFQNRNPATAKPWSYREDFTEISVQAPSPPTSGHLPVPPMDPSQWKARRQGAHCNQPQRSVSLAQSKVRRVESGSGGANEEQLV